MKKGLFIKQGIQERGTECRECGECSLENSGGNTGTGNGMRGMRETRGIFTRIPGNLLEDSRECYYFNIPGNVPEDFGEC